MTNGYGATRSWGWAAIGACALLASGFGWWQLNRITSPTDPNTWDDRPRVEVAGTIPAVPPAEAPAKTSSLDQAAVAADWPGIFGPAANSTAADRNLNWHWPEQGPPELWRQPAGRGYSVPLVAGDRVFLFHRVGDDEVVAAFDATTGAAGWRFAYPTAYRCKFEYSDGPYATPAIVGERIYAFGAEGKLHCLNRHTGEVHWRRDLHADFAVAEGLFGAGASPLVQDDRVYINLGGVQRDAGVVALDAATGRTLWTATDHAAGYATPRRATIHQREYLFVLTAEGLVALQPSTGQLYWEVPFRSKSIDSVNAVTPLVSGDRILLVTGPGPGSLCLRVLPEGGCREVWRDRRVLDSQWNNLIEIDGYVYGFTSKRAGRAQFRCLDLTNGKLCWELDSDLDRGAALAVDGRFLLLGEQGHLGVVDIDPRAARARVLTPEPVLRHPCYTAPALSRGLLYLRNEETLLCLDLRTRQASQTTGRTGESSPAGQ